MLKVATGRRSAQFSELLHCNIITHPNRVISEFNTWQSSTWVTTNWIPDYHLHNQIGPASTVHPIMFNVLSGALNSSSMLAPTDSILVTGEINYTN